MIFTERTITVVNDSATINKPLILYRGDKNIELKITIAESQFKFRNTDASNVIETTDASYAQLVINTPYGSPIFSDVAATKNGAVIFVITEAMIDEIREVGAYEIQIRLLDDNKQSRASIPPVSNAIEIREPIAIEDGSAVDSNAVNVAKVNRALTTTSAPLKAFDSQGNYIKNNWGDGDPITDAALNKIEVGIDGVNKKIGNVNSQIKEIDNKNDVNGLVKTLYKLKRQQDIKGCCIGDSLTYGCVANSADITQVSNPYPKALKEMLIKLYGYNNIDILNLGHPGWNSQQIFETIDDVLLQNPDFAIVMVGTNDLLQAKGTDFLKVGLSNILEKLIKNNIEIVLMTMPDVYDYRFKDELSYYKKIIEELAKTYNTDLCDINSMLNEFIINNVYDPIDFYPDFVHLKDDYYKLISDCLIANIFFKDTLKVDSNKTLSVPAYGNKYIKTNITTCNEDSNMIYKRFLQYPTGGTGLNLLSLVIFNTVKGMSISCIIKQDSQGSNSVQYNFNNMMNSSLNCYNDSLKVNIEVDMVEQLNIGLNIIHINDIGESSKYAYIDGFKIHEKKYWNRLGLYNDWKENLGEYVTVCAKNENGITYLKGTLYGGTKNTDTLIAILPEECRPRYTQVYNLACEPDGDNDDVFKVSINSDGEIKIINSKSGNWISFDGIIFNNK